MARVEIREMVNPPVLQDTVVRARTFAIAAHHDQLYGERPYLHHLDAVAGLLEPFGSAAQVVGYLHDVVEDTSVPLDEIRSQFGALVAECVALVTDVPGSDRQQRKLATNAKLSQIKADDPERLALIVKAADRLANLRESEGNPVGSKLEMYRREHPAFRNAAFRPGLCDELWNQMDRIVTANAGKY